MRTEICEEKIDDAARVCGLAEGTVRNVKRSAGIRERLKQSVPQIRAMATDAVLELGKKENIEVLPEALPKIQELANEKKRVSKKDVKKIINEVKGIKPEPDKKPVIIVRDGPKAEPFIKKLTFHGLVCSTCLDVRNISDNLTNCPKCSAPLTKVNLRVESVIEDASEEMDLGVR